MSSVVAGERPHASRGSWKPWLLASAPVWLFPLREAIALSPVGHDALFALELLVFPAFGLALILVPIVLLVLIWDRGPGMRRLIAYVLLFVAGTMSGLWLKEPVRTAHLHRVAMRAQPLVEAIERYESDQGSPPRALADLVPRYLAAVPQTGLGAHPEFNYDTKETLCERWTLSADVGGFWRPDDLVYCPGQDYPAWYPRVAGWAVHDND